MACSVCETDIGSPSNTSVSVSIRILRSLVRTGTQVWHIKYTRLFWRPVTAIGQGDGTNAADPTWTPFLATPPHPECVASYHIVLHVAGAAQNPIALEAPALSEKRCGCSSEPSHAGVPASTRSCPAA